MKDITHKTEVSGSSPEWPTFISAKRLNGVPSQSQEQSPSQNCQSYQDTLQDNNLRQLIDGFILRATGWMANPH